MSVRSLVLETRSTETPRILRVPRRLDSQDSHLSVAHQGISAALLQESISVEHHSAVAVSLARIENRSSPFGDCGETMSTTTVEGLRCFNDLIKAGEKPPKDYKCFDCRKRLTPPAPYFAKLDMPDGDWFYPVCKECAKAKK